jgi:hypothetical protein
MAKESLESVATEADAVEIGSKMRYFKMHR